MISVYELIFLGTLTVGLFRGLGRKWIPLGVVCFYFYQATGDTTTLGLWENKFSSYLVWIKAKDLYKGGLFLWNLKSIFSVLLASRFKTGNFPCTPLGLQMIFLFTHTLVCSAWRSCLRLLSLEALDFAFLSFPHTPQPQAMKFEAQVHPV